MQKPVNSETDLIKAIWNRTILNEATVEPDLFSGMNPSAAPAEKRAFSPKPKATTQYDQFGFKLTKTGNRAVKQKVAFDPMKKTPLDIFAEPTAASSEPYPTVQTAAKPLRTSAEITGAKDTSGIKVTTAGQPSPYASITPKDYSVSARTAADPVKTAIDQTIRQVTKTVDGIGGFPNNAAADAKWAAGGEGVAKAAPKAGNVFPTVVAKAAEAVKPVTPMLPRTTGLARAAAGAAALGLGAGKIGLGIVGYGVGEAATNYGLEAAGMQGGPGSESKAGRGMPKMRQPGMWDRFRDGVSNVAGGGLGGVFQAGPAGFIPGMQVGAMFGAVDIGRGIGRALGTDPDENYVDMDTSKLGWNPKTWLDTAKTIKSPLLNLALGKPGDMADETLKGIGMGLNPKETEAMQRTDTQTAEKQRLAAISAANPIDDEKMKDPRNFAGFVRSGKMTQADADKKTKEIYGADDANNAAASAPAPAAVTAPVVAAAGATKVAGGSSTPSPKPTSVAPQAAPTGKQYYYPDTFVGREIEPGEKPAATPAPVKKQTVDQQLISTAKQITDKSGAQKAAATSAPAAAPAAKPTRSVTPVQITEPGIPAGQLNQQHVQRPATSQEDLKRVRWNSASYHQLSPDEKKFVEDNDRAQGFDRMTGGQNDPNAPRPTQIQRESYNPEKQEILEHYRQVLAQKLMEQKPHWGMDKVRDAVKRDVINPESYRPDRKGMEHMHSALEGGTISVPPVGGIGHKKAVTNYTQPMDRVFIGNKIFPDNRSAQASLHMIMRSMGNIHGAHSTGFHPALEGTVPHDPATHGPLNQLVPSTIAHTLNLRKAWKLQYP